MMIAALVALAAGAVAGIFLATRHFLRKRLPASVALFHGLGGATGFALVLLTVVRNPTYQPIREVLYLLIATVLLGVVNLLFHVRRVRHRTSLILLHGLTAATSAAMLIRAIVLYAPPADVSPPAQPGAVVTVAPAPAPAGAPAPARADAPAPAPAPVPVPAPASPAAPSIDDAIRKALARPIRFESGSAVIRRSSLGQVAELAAALQAHPQIGLVEVQGHADERGDDARNVALTRARAAAVVDAIAARGVARERLHSAGYGARCPADPACQHADAPDSCHGADAWQRDRRVLIRVLRLGDADVRGEIVCARGAELIPEDDRRFHTASE